MIKAWLQLVRLPNLPTVPGDVVAGAVAAACFSSVPLPSPLRMLAASAASIALYTGGLVDNDIVDSARDATDSPQRPIPSGAITKNAARNFRLLCCVLAFASGAVAGLGRCWFTVAAILTIIILLYNRVKDRFRPLAAPLMGLCRGLNVMCGIAIASECATAALMSCAPVLAGWTLYIAGVTLIAEDEHQAARPLNALRFLPASAAMLPALAPFTAHSDIFTTVLPLAGSLFAAYGFCRAVAPLGRKHDSGTRSKAVGLAIGMLIYLQFGFAACADSLLPLAIVATCFFSRLLIRKILPAISGS